MLSEKICTKNPITEAVLGCQDLIAKVRYVDFQKRSHTFEVQIAMSYKRIDNLSDMEAVWQYRFFFCDKN